MPDTDLTKLLQRKGTIEGLIALGDDQELTQSEIMDRMGVANGTVQKRIQELKDRNLIEETAKISDKGRPQKAYRLTDNGEQRADMLKRVVE